PKPKCFNFIVYLQRIVQGFRNIREQSAHLSFGLKIKIGTWKPETLLFIYLVARIDTKEYIVRFPVFLFQIMGVIGRNDLHVMLTGEPNKGLIDIFLTDARPINILQTFMSL